MASNRVPRYTPDEYRQRPRDYNPGLAQEIIDRIANGQSLTEVCDDRDMPLPATFLRWCRTDPTLGMEYEQAIRDRADVLVEEMQELASGPDPQRARVEVDARKWTAERLVPAKYGARSYQLQPKPEEDKGGVDYAAELRRKIERLAANVAASTPKGG